MQNEHLRSLDAVPEALTYWPAPHSRHLLHTSAPFATVNVPPAHLEQTRSLVSEGGFDWWVPARQTCTGLHRVAVCEVEVWKLAPSVHEAQPRSLVEVGLLETYLHGHSEDIRSVSRRK